MIKRIVAATVGLLTAIILVAGLSVTSGLVLSQPRLKAAIVSGFTSGALGQYDRWIECANATMQYVRHQSVIINALDTRWVRPGQHTCDELQALLVGPPYPIRLNEPSSYVSYPAGARHLQALMLSVTSMSATMTLYWILSYASVVALFLGAWRNSPRLAMVIVAPLTLLLFFAFEQHRFANSTMWAPAFFVGFFALGAFLAMPRWFQNSANRLGFYCFLGIVVGYFDYLHGPLPVILSITIVLDHFFYAARDKDIRWSAAVRNAMTILFCFLLAFALLTALRLGLLSRVTSHPVWADFLGSLGTRLSNKTPDYPTARVTDIVARLWKERGEMSGSAIVSAILLGAGGLAWILSAGLLVVSSARSDVAGTRARTTCVGIFVLAVAGGGILGWYLLFPNHTLIHAWVMVRMLALPVAYGCSALMLAIFWWREKRMRQIQTA